VQRMSCAAFKGYIGLLTAQWQSEDGTLPEDMQELAEKSRLSDEEWEASSASILRRFVRIEGARLRNEVCFQKWLDARTVFEARRKAASTTNSRSPHGHRTMRERSPARSADTRTETDTERDTETEELKLVSEAKASSPRTDSGEADPIEEIYKAYPRKVGKAAAIKAILRGVQHLKARGMPIREAEVYLFRRVQSYARSPAGNDGEFTPHPATWFNRGSYDDDPAEWQKKANEKGSNGNQGRNGFSGEEMSRLLDSFGGSETDQPVRGG
jgi:uncharacterized protein YdaU (DUF1376 family)